MKYVLDTNIVAALLNANAGVLERMSTIAASDVSIPVVVVSELLYGALRSGRVEENLQRAREYVARFEILPADTVLFERYAAVRAVLSERGRPKSDFDLLIACTALVHNATLVTHDDSLKDGTIDGLIVEDWLER